MELFDDINLNRIVKKFIDVISFKVTYEDVWNCDYLCEEAFYTDENGVDRYRRYIYEVLDSKWIDELKKNCDEQDAAVFEDKDFHHYVLMLGDIVLEVISSNIE